MATIDVHYGSAITRTRALLDRRGLSERELVVLERIYRAVWGVGLLLGLPLTYQESHAVKVSPRAELARVRAEVESVLRTGFVLLRTAECNASGDRDVVTDAAYDRRALDALVTILSTGFERLGVGRADVEDPDRREEREQRDGDEEGEGEQRGAHDLNVRPLNGGEVS
jgi:hypothetical protein